MHAKLLAATGAFLAAPFFLALASPASQLVVFGDSLSDNGNAAIALGGTLPGNYAPNAFTDGPNTSPATAGPFGLWIDQFATKIGVSDPTPFLAGGTNYAVASALTGSANPQDIGNQLTAFQVKNLGSASSTALYAVWGGANDLFNSTPANAATVGKTAADNLFSYILTLSGEGAKNFLWLNLPNLGQTPLGAAGGAAVIAALNGETAQFNAEWALDLATLKSDGVNVIGVDINSLFNNILSNPSFGISNTTIPADTLTTNPNSSLFWDEEHPTTAADALIADAAFAAYTAPEPFSAGLSVLGLGAVLAALRFRRKTAEN